MTFIKETNTYRLYSPQGCWETNYTIINRRTDTEYLIDTDDVSDDALSYSELKELNPDTFAPYIWRIGNTDSIQRRANSYTKAIKERLNELLTIESKSHRNIVLEEIKLFADRRQELLTSLQLKI